MNPVVSAARALRAQLIQEHALAPGLFHEMARIESLLAETYRTRVLYELLQNSDDAGSTTVVADMSDPTRLAWRNNGRAFNERDIEALCRSATSSKKRDHNTIGYRGIGFKAVAALSEEVSVTSVGVRLIFNREAAASALQTPVESVPLLRVPASVMETEPEAGAQFTLNLIPGQRDQLVLDPVAMLFLRNVTDLTILRPGGQRKIRCIRSTNHVTLEIDGRLAEFERSAEGDSILLVPLNPHAESITGRHGRLCCFLPLEDELSLPIVASGHLLTEPSRTHAIACDDSTSTVIATIGKLLAQILADPSNPVCDRLWSLILSGEDLRTVVMADKSTPSGMLLKAMKSAFATISWPFAFSEVPLESSDVPRIFPQGAPVSIYRQDASSQARALRTIFDAPTLRAKEIAEKVEPHSLSGETRAALTKHLVDLARVEGRPLTVREQLFAGQSAAPSQSNNQAPSTATNSTPLVPSEVSFGGALTRWRAAEIAAMEHLNARGWSLQDVSRQNVGYDLAGTNADGADVHIEVKKVEGKDARFALTNNEMAVMVGASPRYLLALVIGDGSSAQLALLDPIRDMVPRERVCRRWEWEYSDWSRYVEIVH
ncbi:sacsin N-terminal ATP-binding-like domain-containing protein [Paenarthrobacter sp. NPDC089714]|uniref:sacsin N-terminal ATP-binding-like domain-containing protein n=1 Tax=Paenarthrobacter sp. NPDC089714 TaxID=3364377 RepID=UPI00380A8389